jgi:hypothetical protein
VDWDYEGKSIRRDVIGGVEDRFLSELTPTGENFPVGNYEVKLVLGRNIEGSSKFIVQAQEGSSP